MGRRLVRRRAFAKSIKGNFLANFLNADKADRTEKAGSKTFLSDPRKIRSIRFIRVQKRTGTGRLNAR
jgi:hypothetical protein